MSVLGIGITTSEPITTWANLDQSNRITGFYSRRPQYLVEADTARDEAWAEHNRLINESLERGEWLPEVEEAQKVAELAEAHYSACCECWHIEQAAALAGIKVMAERV